jgi:hypothetical protein
MDTCVVRGGTFFCARSNSRENLGEMVTARVAVATRKKAIAWVSARRSTGAVGGVNLERKSLRREVGWVVVVGGECWVAAR